MFSLLSLLSEYQSKQQACVMATLYDTQGSTYRKPGARMLIDSNGKFHGLLSGGCFEPDIQMHAKQVIESGESRLVTYDLLAEDDMTWGIGAGCKGAIRILLQPLVSEQDFEPFLKVHRCLMASKSTFLVTTWQQQAAIAQDARSCVVTHDNHDFAIDTNDTNTEHSQPIFPVELQLPIQNALQRLGRPAHRDSATSRSGACLWAQTHPSLNYMVELIRPPIHLMVLGAGIDAVPLVKMALALEWQVTVVDHRQHHLSFFADLPVNRLKCRPAKCEQAVKVAADAIVIMSHHFESDGHYLTMAKSHSAEYVGLLGPAERRNELIAAQNLKTEDFNERLFSPIGLDIGAETPNEIALSIMAEIKGVLAVSSARSLKFKSSGIHD